MCEYFYPSLYVFVCQLDSKKIANNRLNSDKFSNFNFETIRNFQDYETLISRLECNLKSKIFKSLDKFFLQNLKILRLEVSKVSISKE